MAEIGNKILELKESLPETCTLVAISKTKSVQDIGVAYEAGQRDFGENKVQELVEKAERLPKDIRWHMVGHLQRNKVKYIAPFVHLIHGVDSIRLLEEIDKQATKIERTVQCLCQVHIAEESTKFGFDKEELKNYILSSKTIDMSYVNISGLMGMATYTENLLQIRKEFSGLKKYFDMLRADIPLPHFEVLSMGMSRDYTLAVTEGSNMVRIGSAIFGER